MAIDSFARNLASVALGNTYDDSEIRGELASETSQRKAADNNLQSQIDGITASSDVKDIVGYYAELEDYDTSTLGDKDIIKVLQDETKNDAQTYYRWNATTKQFTYIGEEGPYYTKAQSDEKFLTIDNMPKEIYIGEEEPTDEDIELWINPEGDPSDIGKWNEDYHIYDLGISFTEVGNNDKTIAAIIKVLNKAVKDDTDKFFVRAGANIPVLFEFVGTADWKQKPTSGFWYLRAIGTFSDNYGNPINKTKNILFMHKSLQIRNFTWTGDEITGIYLYFADTVTNSVMSTTNEAEYNPTKPFHPATKKYVDTKAEELDDRIDEIELSKFPNVTIFGTPTILQGQVSDFSANDYLEFPFMVDFKGRSFEINFAFTTGDDIDNQQNILDSEFGLAFAIRNKHFVMALSYNGTSWATEQTGTFTLEPAKTYRVKISWSGLVYRVQYSTDGGTTYETDIQFGGTSYPYPKQMYIGVGKLAQNYFKGSINLNYADVIVESNKIWMGMDDAGLALRADINLENITEIAEQKIKDLAGGGSNYTAGTNIEITEDNVINNTFPSKYELDGNKQVVKIGKREGSWNSVLIGNIGDIASPNNSIIIGGYQSSSIAPSQSVAVGSNIYNNSNTNTNSVGIGDSVFLLGTFGTAVGSGARASAYSSAFGAGSVALKDKSVALGMSASTTKSNQFMLGSTNYPINEMKVVTSDGEKQIATTDDITNAIGQINEILATLVTVDEDGE